MKTIIQDGQLIVVEDINFDIRGAGGQSVHNILRGIRDLRGEFIKVRQFAELKPEVVAKLKQAASLLTTASKKFDKASGIAKATAAEQKEAEALQKERVQYQKEAEKEHRAKASFKWSEPEPKFI